MPPASPSSRPQRHLSEVLASPTLKILFVSGKGGVGKTVISQAIAEKFAGHAGKEKKTLWLTFEDPNRPPGEKIRVSGNLDSLNADSIVAFDEYVALKIGVPALTHIFLNNRLVRYLAKAAPGIHELVLLGKVWHMRKTYDRVIVDMPSTGHSVAMFQSVANFARLFQGGPLNRDAEAMLDTFRDPALSAHLIVGLPEEMPLRESLELGDLLAKLFPKTPPAYFINKRFPSEPEKTGTAAKAETPDQWQTPVATSALDYIRKRVLLEEFNLKTWRDEGIQIEDLPYFRPPVNVAGSLDGDATRAPIVAQALKALVEKYP